MERLTPVLARFTAQRPAVDTLLRAVPALDGGYRSSTQRWMNEFWDDAREPKRMMGRVRVTCDKY